MGERQSDPQPHRLVDRRDTDESLEQERSATDELLDPHRDQQRVLEAVREGRHEAERLLRNVRADSDAQLEKQADGLPAVSDQLEQVAESLSAAAESVDTPVGDAAPGEASGLLAEQLAEIADGITEITNTLSQERRDADRSLREERQITDRIIVEELTQVETNLTQDLCEEREALRDDRQTTDEDLAKERRNTDEAVEHVLGLLDEEQRDHAHAARSAATRNEFLAIVSHDLRGPLTTISGLAALIDQQAPADEVGHRMRGWAERISRSVSVMERLISDLLDFGSFEDGRLRVVAERLDLCPLIHGAIEAFHGAARAKDLGLEADLPAGPLVAKHDPHRILQVLSNLVHNAIKFTPEGGAIRIRAAREGAFCIVSVTDTGVGIPDGELTAIFDRFRQLDRSDRTGLGLGLYIARWIVEAHGGRIWAESHAGAGTTFFFTLPKEP